MLLRFPEPYDFTLSTERFRSFGDDLANRWVDDALHRVVEGRLVTLRAAAGGVDVEPLDAVTGPVVEKLLGVEHDLEGFRDWARGRPVLGELVDRLPGLRPPVVPDPWEALVTSITAQQVSLLSASAIRSRFIAAFGVGAGVAHAFPMRERVAELDEAELVAVGFSRPKAAYVVGLARSELDLEALFSLDDADVRERLVAIRGLGPWTAEWFLGRHLARPRAWPTGDLALRKAVDLFYGLDVHAVGSLLDPFQNLSAHYLLAGARTP